MGFDILGNNGKDYRASAAAWGDLWQFCVEHSPEAAAVGPLAWGNNRVKVSADAAARLAQALRDKVADGTAEHFGSYLPDDDDDHPPFDQPNAPPPKSYATVFVDRVRAFADFAADSGGFKIA